MNANDEIGLLWIYLKQAHAAFIRESDIVGDGAFGLGLKII